MEPSSDPAARGSRPAAYKVPQTTDRSGPSTTSDLTAASGAIEPTPLPASPFARSWEHWILLGIALTGIVVIAVLGILVDPDPRGFGTHETFGFPPCKPMLWWNFPCPGCGVTTSVSLAAHGHFWTSIRNQPFGFVVAMLLPAFAAWCGWQVLRGRDLKNAVHGVRAGRWALVLAGVMMAAWIYKVALTRHWIG